MRRLAGEMEVLWMYLPEDAGDVPADWTQHAERERDKVLARIAETSDFATSWLIVQGPWQPSPKSGPTASKQD